MTDGAGIPIGVVAAPANRNDSPLLPPTLALLSRFEQHLPETITVHLDAGYDSAKTRALLTTLGHDWQISTKANPYKPEPAGLSNAPTLGTTVGSKNFWSIPNAEPGSTTPLSR